ncbi:conserved Plasmodium protein, unknown function [Plasmodium berghei]|uniref:Methyltransferase, putative n=2 Tax=Plasmodium berghei TaxID=5821 RepID=A0A509AKK5_PLABA|nr:methyltransferase, putative [Plasmodium berghei ANKA]CXI49819.1 conserved Plasmodium protein, unknown function [Plasmodium berghei]SCL94110.1 conserved Plasmodium protein, unknown function [Plasmodium berghei]SCM15944.1 conserved Plasmodium protein, unknown function [Plasmodium berghei]SCM17740.1 conserved Plasmodium protein, unknown function [Plasmodium berghei]SCN25931.1 conserved Plasmodium protein, unknown function [Plasmodium berghei]|eukprot:XP_034421869.1 methyltransferase, putative [Plasmodium berghei ANKA]
MEVLPAGFSDFRSREYWNSFFQAFDKKNFEWYGSYKDIKNIVYECIRKRLSYCDGENDDIGVIIPQKLEKGKQISKNERVNKNCLLVNIGCGNSNLSYEFFDDGFDSIINIDYSDVVISKMKNKFGKMMEFINIDINNKECFENFLESLDIEKKKKKKNFKIFFDKAFLDAYISGDDSEEEVCKNNAKNYFESIFKYMNEGDIFIIITLAQYYIIKEVVRNIYNADIKLDVNPFMIKKNTNEFRYHPFVFSFYKTNIKLKDYTMKLCNFENNDYKIISLWKLPHEIRQIRDNLNLHSFKKGKRIILDIFNQNINKCEYNIIVYDSNVLKTVYNTVVIVVPFGYEFHSLYSTSEGNEELATKTKGKRLLLVMRSNFIINEFKIPHENNKSIANCESIKGGEMNNTLESNEKREDNSNHILNGNESTTNVQNNKNSLVSENNISNSNSSEFSAEASNTSNLYEGILENQDSVSILLKAVKSELNKIINELALPNSKNFPIMALNEDIKNYKIICHEKSNYCSNIIIRDVLVTDEFISDNFGASEDNKTKKNGKNKKKLPPKNNTQNGSNSEKGHDNVVCEEKNNKITHDDSKKLAIKLIKKNTEEKKKYFQNKEIYKRQMIFSYDPLTVQSEIIYTKEKKKTNKLNEHEKIIFEYIESSSQYHVNFCCTFFLFILNNCYSKDNNLINICILGGGTNVLSNIIKSIFCDFNLYFNIVEIDETVQKLYKFFYDKEEISNDKHVTNYIINDSYEYIKNVNQPKYYDIIFVDMNNSENSYLNINGQKLYITCPHISLLNKDVIIDIKNILNEKGVLVINLLTRDSNARKYVYQFLKDLFSSVISISSANKEINEVLVCSPNYIKKETIFSFKMNIMKWIRCNHNKWFLNFDLASFLNNITIL